MWCYCLIINGIAGVRRDLGETLFATAICLLPNHLFHTPSLSCCNAHTRNSTSLDYCTLAFSLFSIYDSAAIFVPICCFVFIVVLIDVSIITVYSLCASCKQWTSFHPCVYDNEQIWISFKSWKNYVIWMVDRIVVLQSNLFFSVLNRKKLKFKQSWRDWREWEICTYVNLKE